MHACIYVRILRIITCVQLVQSCNSPVVTQLPEFTKETRILTHAHVQIRVRAPARIQSILVHIQTYVHVYLYMCKSKHGCEHTRVCV
jgi:hypothetical protein